MKIVKKLILEIEYIFLNCFVNNIPLWIVRKLLYQLLGMKIGKGSRILMHCRVYSPRKIAIGNNTMINECCYLDGRGGIIIGSNVTIATYAKLITGSHNIDDNAFGYCDSPILIEDNSAVFSASVVLGGAVLRKGCVISAMSLVRKGEYNKCGIYGGNPAKYIRDRKSNVSYQQCGLTIFR